MQDEDTQASKPGLNLLLGEKCLKLATLRLIADNISFLGGRLDQARIVLGAHQGWERFAGHGLHWSWSGQRGELGARLAVIKENDIG